MSMAMINSAGRTGLVVGSSVIASGSISRPSESLIQKPETVTRFGWLMSLISRKARNSLRPALSSTLSMTLMASVTPPGPFAFQTSPKPPRPRRASSS